MFTGIITHLGILKVSQGSTFIFEAPSSFLKKVTKGTSISVNGVCLTIASKISKKTFLVELMPETLKRTTLGLLKKGSIVNLELPATPSTLLSGHIVQGHVDGVGIVKKISLQGNGKQLMISFPKDLKKYIVPKGSIAINGVSLTVIGTLDNTITLGIIPYTFKQTILHQLKVLDQVNIEVDILAKYIWQKM